MWIVLGAGLAACGAPSPRAGSAAAPASSAESDPGARERAAPERSGGSPLEEARADVWIPDGPVTAWLRGSFRLIGSREGRDERIFELSNGGALPEYLVGGPRPSEALARHHPDGSVRTEQGRVWYRVASDGSLLNLLTRDGSPMPSPRCHLTGAGGLHCRDEDSELLFTIDDTGVILVDGAGHPELVPLDWRVEPPPTDDDARRQALLHFWHDLVISFMGPGEPV